MIEYYRVNPTLFDRFLRFCIANHSKLISVSKVYEYLKSLRLKCSKSTLIKYLEFSKEVFFLLPVEIFFLLNKGEKALPKKLYIVDNGLVSYPRLKAGASCLTAPPCLLNPRDGRGGIGRSSTAGTMGVTHPARFKRTREALRSRSKEKPQKGQ